MRLLRRTTTCALLLGLGTLALALTAQAGHAQTATQEQEQTDDQAQMPPNVQIEAVGGDWLAMRDSGQDSAPSSPNAPKTSSTEVCAALNIEHDGDMAPLMLRADRDGLEIRSASVNWNLTPQTQGELSIKAGSYDHSFLIFDGDQHLLGTFVTPQAMRALIDALENTRTATLEFGNKTRMTLNMQDARNVLEAFKSCTTKAGFADLENMPETTPF